MPEKVTFVAEADGTEVADGEFRVVFEADKTFTTSDPGLVAFLERQGFKAKPVAKDATPTVLKEKKADR